MLFQSKEMKTKLSYIENLLAGYDDYFYAVFNNLHCYDRENMRTAAAYLSKKVKELNFRDLTAFLTNIEYYSYYLRDTTVFTDTGLNKIQMICPEYFPEILVIGSHSSSGYIRENCVKRLDNYPQYLYHIVYRLNDWVPQVRLAAEKAILSAADKASCKNLLCVCGLMHEMTVRGRYNTKTFAELTELISKRIGNTITENDLHNIQNINDEKLRQNIYRRLFFCNILSHKQAAWLLDNKHNFTPRDYCLRMWLYSIYITKYNISREELIRHTKSKLPVLRLAAVNKLLEDKELWDGAQELLCDKSCSVRSAVAQCLAETSDFDVRAFYISRLPCHTAVLGLGENGCADDEGLLLPLISQDNAKTASSAVSALCKLTGKKHMHLFYSLISDNRLSVSKAAYKAFSVCEGTVATQTAYEEIIKAENNSHQQNRLIKALCQQGAWNAMPQLIRLYPIGNSLIYQSIERIINNPRCYFTGSLRLAEDIISALNETNMPDELRKQIFFCVRR